MTDVSFSSKAGIWIALALTATACSSGASGLSTASQLAAAAQAAVDTSPGTATTQSSTPATTPAPTTVAAANATTSTGTPTATPATKPATPSAPTPAPTPAPAPTPTPAPTPPPTAAASTADVTIIVDPTSTHPISPYIYGINDYTGHAGGQPNLTLDRDGGDRWTAYNWETNASNAGSDYLYENDDYLTSSSVPGEAVRSFIAADQGRGMASLFTVQMQGLVAADESGPVSVNNAPQQNRFKTVVYQKSAQSNAPFTMTPPTGDAYVYMDEFVWAMDRKFAGQNIFESHPSTHPVFIQLDNEPELWNTTHLEVQGSKPVASDAYIAKSLALAKAIKAQFPSALVFGPVHYGFNGIYSWQGELGATPDGGNWFPDKYLPALKAAAAAAGRPLVDIYDFHWYSEATDGAGNRVINLNGTTLTDAQVQAIAQSPRSLWDPTYKENSWITNDVLGAPINILGRLQSRIAAENPGMRLSITEYNNGGGGHIAGTLAQADNLGIFGAQGLFAANFWSVGNSGYILGGFGAFRDFDGANANFGDVSVHAVSNHVDKVAVYASTDSTHPNRVVFVAINRSTTAQVTAIEGQPLSGTAHVFRITGASAKGQSAIKPTAAGTLAASGTSLTVTLPPLSVTTLDIY